MTLASRRYCGRSTCGRPAREEPAWIHFRARLLAIRDPRRRGAHPMATSPGAGLARHSDGGREHRDGAARPGGASPRSPTWTFMATPTRYCRHRGRRHCTPTRVGRFSVREVAVGVTACCNHARRRRGRGQRRIPRVLRRPGHSGVRWVARALDAFRADARVAVVSSDAVHAEGSLGAA